MKLPDFITFGGILTHVTEAVSILQCNGLTDEQIFRWLERKYAIGQFAAKNVSA